jgi:EasF-like predicted methyltransferase
MQKRVDYFALDLSLEELERTFAEVSPQRYQYVRLHALHGTYDDAMDWLHMPENRQQPTWVLSLGSSLGNFNRPDAAAFLNRFARLLGPSDALIIGLDGCTDRDRIFKAYNDSKGITHEFYRNGLVHANAVLGQEAFKPDEWAVHCIYDDAQGCHQAFYVPTRDVTIQGNRLHRGEQIIFEEAYKYDRRQREQLWRNAGLIPVAAYGNSSANDYREFLIFDTIYHHVE